MAYGRGGSAGRLAAAAAVGFLAAGAAQAYTVVTRDGHRIVATAKPEVKGSQVLVRLAPGGRLAVIPQDKVDWERTQAANPRPAPAGMVVPADAMMAGEGTGSSPRPPIEKRIVGERARRRPGAGQDPPAAAGAPAAPGQQAIASQEALINLQKEYVQVTAARAEAAAHKDFLDRQLAALQSQHAAHAGDDSDEARRLLDLQDQVRRAAELLSKLDNRLADIRAEAVQHGGSID
ncbi:MAG TPA: hypothetical protein VJV23_09200 [Candidatus Polarisedimenticolia bacterium]|nr:hypothetical protein [Candidatus Polarisedimenticolia bacterium]